MTNAQKIALRVSEIRKRLPEIAALEGDTFTDEVRAEAGLPRDGVRRPRSAAHESGSGVVGADDATKFVADKRMFEISGHGELGHDRDLWRVTVGATGHSHGDIRLRGR